jgi:hypothetical protein
MKPKEKYCPLSIGEGNHQTKIKVVCVQPSLHETGFNDGHRAKRLVLLAGADSLAAMAERIPVPLPESNSFAQNVHRRKALDVTGRHNRPPRVELMPTSTQMALMFFLWIRASVLLSPLLD